LTTQRSKSDSGVSGINCKLPGWLMRRGKHYAAANSSRSLKDSGKSLSDPKTVTGLPRQIWSKQNTGAAHGFEIHTFRHGCDSNVRLHFSGLPRGQNRVVVVITLVYVNY
jgi:hypothetical protein